MGFLTFFSIALYFLADYFFFKKIEKANDDFLNAQDKRLKYSNEIFSNIKAVIMNDWNEKFERNISNFRNTELKCLYYILLYQVTVMILTTIFPQLANIINFSILALFGKTLTIGTVLAMINLITQLANPFSYIPYILVAASQAISSSKRIEKIFDLEDDGKTFIQHNKNDKSEYAITIDNCSFEWKSKEIENINYHTKNIEERKAKERLEDNKAALLNEKNEEKVMNKRVLNNINLQIKKGELIFIIGGLGSGKSSLMHALNNDLITVAHSDQNNNHYPININGNVAYVDQNPWLQAMTVKDNICFLSKYEENKMKKVIKLCQLEEDLKVLQNDINTEVGEKGSNLSGGQKMRVTLARAVYSDADIYLLDDPLTSLDNDTKTKIVKECICGALKGKTILLSTHCHEYLPYADKILKLKNERIEFFGTFSEFMNNNKELSCPSVLPSKNLESSPKYVVESNENDSTHAQFIS